MCFKGGGWQLQLGADNVLPPTVLRVSQINATERRRNERVGLLSIVDESAGMLLSSARDNARMNRCTLPVKNGAQRVGHATL